MGKFLVALLAAIVVAGGVVAVVLLVNSDEDDGETEETETAAVEIETAVVAKRDITETRTVEGVLGFGETDPFPTGGSGVVTSLPAEGARIELGDVLYWLDNHPVFMWSGAVPMYRDFEEEMEDGTDVLQLEETLAFIGYGDNMSVDKEFTTATTAAIEDWQTDIGVPSTGEIEKGKIVFFTGPIRIASVDTTVGAQIIPDQVIFETSAFDQVVVVELPPEDRDLFAPEELVEVRFPDETTVGGVVTTVREITKTASVAESVPGVPADDEASNTVIEVTIVLLDDPGDSAFEGAPVEIDVVTSELTGVLVVPVPSLLALAGGGHAIEVVEEEVNGITTTRLVGVELGEFADGMVEITGELEEGDVVIVAP